MANPGRKDRAAQGDAWNRYCGLYNVDFAHRSVCLSCNNLEKDKRATTNVQNGLAIFFLFFFILFE